MVRISTYTQVQQALESFENILILDVREKSESLIGTIPKSEQIPFSELTTAFALSEDDFEETYHFEKPTKDQQIICFCRSGIRSHAACEYLIGRGFTNTSNYKASYLEWALKEKE